MPKGQHKILRSRGVAEQCSDCKICGKEYQGNVDLTCTLIKYHMKLMHGEKLTKSDLSTYSDNPEFRKRMEQHPEFISRIAKSVI